MRNFPFDSLGDFILAFSIKQIWTIVLVTAIPIMILGYLASSTMLFIQGASLIFYCSLGQYLRYKRLKNK